MLQGGGGIDPRMTAREALALYGAFHRSPRARRAARAGRPGDATAGGPGTGRRRRRAAAARLALGARRAAESSSPRRADRRDGPRGPGGDAGAPRPPPRGGRHGAADEPRPGRRRAGRRPDRDPRPRAAGRDRVAGELAAAGAAAVPLPARTSATRGARASPTSALEGRPGRRRGRPPIPARWGRGDPALVAALGGVVRGPRACSSSSCGPAPRRLEERYLELVGEGGGGRRTVRAGA